MKDNNIFDAPEPRFKQDKESGLYIPDSDSFEDIGAPLIAGTSFSVDTQLTARARDLNVDGSKIYVAGGITGQTGTAIRRYTLTGTYESAGNLTYPGDTRPSGIPSSWIVTQSTPFFLYNNNWYRSVQWATFSPTPQSRYVFDRHNSNLVYQQTLWMLPINQLINLFGFDIYNNRIYVQTLTESNVLQIRNLSNGALISGTNSIPLDFSVSGGSGGVAVTPTRIYIVSGLDNIIRAYNHMGSRVSADDTTLPSGTTLFDIDASGEMVYVLGRTGTSGSYSYSVIPYTQDTYSATWGSLSYSSTTRIITATLTLSEDPGSAFNASQDFEIQARSGQTAPYTRWIVEVSPARTDLDEVSFTVSGNTVDDVTSRGAGGAGRYIIELATAISTLSAGSVTVDQSRFPGVRVTATEPANPISWSASTGWTIAGSGTGTTRSITATPASTVTPGVYRIRLKQNAFGTNKPRLNVDSGEQLLGAAVYSATWGIPSYDSVTRGITAVLTLSEDPSTTFSAMNDFEVEVRSGSVGSYTWSTSSNWTLSSTGTGTSRTITATPANSVRAGTYRILLKEDAFGTDKPNCDVTSSGQAVAAYVPPYSASWATPTYTASTRAITAVLTLSEDPGSGFSTTDDFEVEVRSGSVGSYTWATSSGWAFTSTGTGTTRTITATPSGTVADGTYRLVVLEDAFGTNKPSSDVVSAGQAIVYSATWGMPSYDSVTRAISSTLTLTQDPGSAFSVTADFNVERRSGSVGSYTWASSSGWTLSSTGTGTSRTITATPTNTVPAGTYRISLNEDAFGTNKPNSDVTTSEQAVGAYVLRYSASWASPTYISATRAIRSVLTLSEDPGSAFSVSNDFKVQMRSGSPGSYSWSDASNWTLSATGTGTTRTITATPTNAVIAGTYRLVLLEDAFGTDKPTTDRNSNGQTILDFYSGTWGSVTYNSGTRAITSTITLSEDPGSGFSVINDFEVEVRSGVVGSYTWSRSSDWALSATGSGTTRTITATPGNLVLANTYRLVLKVNAFGTNKPRLAINSDGQAISNYESPYSATWGMPSYTTNTRAISVILTLSEDPGSAFSASSDFRVQIRSGSPGSYSWANSSGWSLSSTGTGITRTITATPSNSVIAGTYRLVLNRNAFGSGKPSTDTTASEQAVAAYVAPHSLDGQDQFYFDFNIPQDEIGTLQIFVKGSSFYVSGESDLTNLADGQYLGSIGFDTRTATPTTDRSWAFWDNLEGGTTLKGRLHFIGDAITALANTDIEVLLHGTGNRDTNFNITVSSSAVSAGQYVEVEATPLSTYYADGTFRFRLKSDSVMVGTQTAPSENVDSNPISLNTLLVWGPVSHGSSKGYIESTLTFNSDYIDIGTADFSILDQTDEVLDEWTITITPSVTTRSTGTTLVVRGTPSPSRPVYDSFRLQLNRSSIRFSNRQANHAPTNNLISNPILVATAEAPEPAANVPYLVVEAIPAGTQTGTEVVIDLEAQLNGVAADIDGLRPEDFVITSPEGNITPTLATR